MNQHDVFFLARYAYNTINPAVEELRVMEPSASFEIEMTFDNHKYREPSHITIAVRWDGPRATPVYDYCLTTTEQVDRTVEKLRKLIAVFKADICKGCDRHVDDEEYGRDEDCGTCFVDGAPLTQEEVTAPTSPEREFEAEYQELI